MNFVKKLLFVVIYAISMETTLVQSQATWKSSLITAGPYFQTFITFLKGIYFNPHLAQIYQEDPVAVYQAYLNTLPQTLQPLSNSEAVDDFIEFTTERINFCTERFTEVAYNQLTVKNAIHTLCASINNDASIIPQLKYGNLLLGDMLVEIYKNEGGGTELQFYTNCPAEPPQQRGRRR